GKHRFYMCTNIACMLRGAQELTQQLRAFLGLRDPDEVTDDGLFSVEEVECLGCCEFGPVARIDHRFHYDLTMEKLTALVAERRAQGAEPATAMPPVAEPVGTEAVASQPERRRAPRRSPDQRRQRD